MFFTQIFSTILAQLPVGRPITFNEIDYLIAKVATYIMLISVSLAIIFIVRAGITWMSAGADTSRIDEAKAQLKSGIIGALIVLGVGVIINTLAAIVTRGFFCQLDIFGICLIP